ncbi:uncharacterized protein N7503_007228 [Penicillium pulvis]|uniref:uncharacterized protein n=1 Tax=Penicillium pulvis TaxID=1562058 RepID=UPI0025491C83|nr:uncharacterized protein N7503_007228 [Penicillium pulvis]KAJ5797932.1 hypothetical protein N7503_007228 [Penicillium pulvis]
MSIREDGYTELLPKSSTGQRPQTSDRQETSTFPETALPRITCISQYPSIPEFHQRSFRSPTEQKSGQGKHEEIPVRQQRLWVPVPRCSQ